MKQFFEFLSYLLRICPISFHQSWRKVTEYCYQKLLRSSSKDSSILQWAANIFLITCADCFGQTEKITTALCNCPGSYSTSYVQVGDLTYKCPKMNKKLINNW